MKKILVFLTILLVPQAVLPQSWISDNAVWHYGYFNLMQGGFHKIEYVADTIIEGHQCERLEVTQHTFYPYGGNWLPGPVVALEPRFTYFNNDTVYYWNDTRFDILYCFAAQPGDSWDLGIDTNELSCSKSIINVDSVGLIELNGETYRWISVSPEPTSSYYLSGKIIERFGSFETYLFPLMQCCDSNIIVEFDVFDFHCFEDDDFELLMMGVDDCDNPFAVGINEREEAEIYVGPNPTSGFLLISVPNEEAGTLAIYNSLGVRISDEHIHDGQHMIDLSGHPDGIYFLKYLGKDLCASTFKVIKK
jgi:hypothetical protein